MERIFPKEQKIWKIGGAMQRDYVDFRKEIILINESLIPLFILLGFTLRDKDKIIEALIAHYTLDAIRQNYVEIMKEKIRVGKIKLENLLSKHVLEERNETPEHRERRITSQIYRSIGARYKETYKKFEHLYKPPTLAYSKKKVEILRDCLILEPTGFSIDVDKFIDVYGSYLEAKGATTYQTHKALADAINRFFNGAVAITQDELRRYFRLENGIIVPNPNSINREDYLRLGYKGK